MGAPKNYPATVVGYATEAQAAAIREFAWRHRISIAELVRRACERYVRRGKP